jgi:hypothetical protein
VLGDPTSRHLVLRELTTQCPDDAHFWNHLGRHYMYEMRSTAEAERCVKLAIKLEPENTVHHHALGMVYRIEVERIFSEKLIPLGRSADEGVVAIRDLVEYAQQCFNLSRRYGPESEHGYIAEIQMITKVIFRLRHLAGCTFGELLGRQSLTSDWCRELLPQAEELLRQVKSLQAQDRLSRRTSACESFLLEITVRDAESLVRSLSNLMHRPNIHRAPIRQILARLASDQGRVRTFKELSSKQLRTIYSLMEQNLREQPDYGPDIYLWFQAFRHLREFDALEAISRLNGWAAREESFEAHYYLYILHFIRWKQDIAASESFVKENIERCKALALARRIRRTTSDEWLGRSPEWCPLAHYTELGV